MKQSVLRRVLSVLLCVSLLLSVSVVRPQKVEAVAISASIVASVLCIMTACGVSFWASTQDEAIDYMADKITSYFGSLDEPPASYEDWLGISSIDALFSVTANGAMSFGSSITNKILAFVRWFNFNHGIVSDGASLYYPARDIYVVQDDKLNSHGRPAQEGSINAVSDGEDTVAVTINGLYANGATVYPRFAIKLSDNTTGKRWDCTVTAPNFVSNSCEFNVSFASYDPEQSVPPLYLYGWQNLVNGAQYQKTNTSGGTYLIICIRPNSGEGNAANGAARFVFREHIFGDARTRVTPSEVVAVPEDVADEQSFDVVPSVPLSDGMDVGQASAAVLGGVISEDGLTSEGEAIQDATGGWGWLSDILGSIRDFVAGIAQTVLGIPQAIGQAASDVITGIQSLPQLISDALVDLFVPDEAYIGEFVASLHDIFDNRFSILSYPFSILGEFITRASGIDGDEPVLRWPDIYEPFSGQLLIGAGSYNLNQIRQGNFAQAHGLYMVVVKGWIAFEFLGYLYSWFCSVFKMREDDFVSPLEAYDGGDDG